MASQRRQWKNSSGPPSLLEPAKEASKVKEEHSYHLLMLQERNRLLKQLQQKDRKQIELERKEQGFALYLNGANQVHVRPHLPKHSQTREQPHHTGFRIAGDTHPETEVIHEEDREYLHRSKTAPSKMAPSKRRSWVHSSVEVRTGTGDALQVKAPGIISGSYEEDFECSSIDKGEEEEMEEDDDKREGKVTKKVSRERRRVEGEGGGSGVEEESASSSENELTDSFQSISADSITEEEEKSIESENKWENREDEGEKEEVEEKEEQEEEEVEVDETEQGEEKEEAHVHVLEEEKCEEEENENNKEIAAACLSFPFQNDDLALQFSSWHRTASRKAPSTHHQHSLPHILHKHPPPLTHHKHPTSLTKHATPLTKHPTPMTKHPTPLIRHPLSNYDANSVQKEKQERREEDEKEHVEEREEEMKEENNGKEREDEDEEEEEEVKEAKERGVGKTIEQRGQRKLLLLLGRLDQDIATNQPEITPTPHSSQITSTPQSPLTTFTPHSSQTTPTPHLTLATPTPHSKPMPEWLKRKTKAISPVPPSSSSSLLTPHPSSSSSLLTPHPLNHPTSGRVSGLRGKLRSQQNNSIHTPPLSPYPPPTTTTYTIPSSPHISPLPPLAPRPLTGPSGYEQPSLLFQPANCRVSGLKGELMSASTTDHQRHTFVGMEEEKKGRRRRGRREEEGGGRRSGLSVSRPASSRTTGVRGSLTSGRVGGEGRGGMAERGEGEEEGMFVRHCSSEPSLQGSEFRPQTAVLAQGHRPIVLGPLETDILPLPTIRGEVVVSGAEGERSEEKKSLPTRKYSEVHTFLSVGTTPTDSVHEPAISTYRPVASGNLEQSLVSISRFDHTHLGQLGSGSQDDDIMEAFLSEYRTQKPFHSAHYHGMEEEQKEEEKEMKREEEEEQGAFFIPELPSGHLLVLNILTTWGDCHYVGLTGLEIFTAEGERALISHISADPPDINILREYHGDPRVVSNLLDGINRTQDDLHMWLTPFTPSHPHIITLTFTTFTTLALIRIWNYNKSRIHSTRGARHMEMWLDRQCVFQGEVMRASGGLQGGTEAFGETILFTTDEDVLMRIAEHDDCFYGDMGYHGNSNQIEENEAGRPITGDGAVYKTEDSALGGREDDSLSDEGVSGDGVSSDGVMNAADDKRPFTVASLTEPHPKPHVPHQLKPHPPEQLYGQVVQLMLVSSWGMGQGAGLTGLQLLGTSGQPIRVEKIEAFPQDDWIGSIESLLNGDNLTCTAGSMWLCPLNPSLPSTLTLTLPSLCPLHALRLWNYNRSPEDSLLGVKILQIFVDGSEVSPEGGFLIRKAPGHVQFDYSQLIFLSSTPSTRHPSPSTPYPSLPTGFIYQLQLLNTWGDPYYLGLNGIEFYDQDGCYISLTLQHIAAYPDSVNALSGVGSDVRTPDKLVDGVYDTRDGHHMWLAPILPHIVNSVYVIFDSPQTVSIIKIWNYAKTASRGVQDFSVLVDEQLVYSGSLPPVPTHAQAILPTLQPPLQPSVVSLTLSEGSSEEEGGRRGGKKMLGEQRRWPSVANQSLRPLTSLTRHYH